MRHHPLVFCAVAALATTGVSQSYAETVFSSGSFGGSQTVPSAYNNTASNTPVLTATNNSSSYQPQNNFQQCLANLRGQAISSGVSASTYDHYTRNLSPDYSVIDKLNFQPEFRTDIWDYLSALVDDERVRDGQAKIAEHRQVLERASRQYGVPVETIVAVWGVESNFGAISGNYPLVQALSTLSCEGRRQSYFRGEFFTTLKILQRGDLTEDQMKGSWAGAFGHTQFMPSTYDRLAVDFDGDGRRDLVSSIPDALASTANFLKRANWQTGMPWGFEVRADGVSASGRTNKSALSGWANRGVTRMDGSPLIQGNLSGSTPAALIAPAGNNGPKFIVFRNFDALYSYNAAESYALAIALLSDRLQGKSGVTGQWPTDDAGTSRAERREIQQLLLNRGHDIGAVDGLIGDHTRQAIRIEQQRLGLNTDGRAGQKILNALRQGR
ncbi:lytic murein transglycosylase [Acinetobacter sp. c1-l78]|uniref:lytic murein transglycosylase n=1 Tax=Acinetobacter sp. c1-l78 TaxID=3342803 RepID=UPI0035BA137C